MSAVAGAEARESRGQDIAPLLKDIRPSGWLGAAGHFLLCLPIWAVVGSALLVERLRLGPWPKQKDRSLVKHPDAFPGLEEVKVHVGQGITLAGVSPGRRPDKPLLLMLHGFPEFWYSWRHQIVAFKDDYDVVAIDMRGYNKSDKPEGFHNYSLDKLIADVPAVVKGLGHSSCILAGHDWGGCVAWLTAATHPDLVQRLVIVAAPHLGLAQINTRPTSLAAIAQIFKFWYISLFQAPLLPELLLSREDYRAIVEMFRGPHTGLRNQQNVTDEKIERYKQALAQPGALTAQLNYYRALMRNSTAWPIPQVWDAMKRRLRMPVLVVWGEKDAALSPVLMDRVEQVAPDVQLHVLKDCSHWVQQDYPEATTGLMRTFLAKPCNGPVAVSTFN